MFGGILVNIVKEVLLKLLWFSMKQKDKKYIASIVRSKIGVQKWTSFIKSKEKKIISHVYDVISIN